jgi:hypothetical protein
VEIPGDNAVVDDVGVQIRQVEIPNGLGHEERRKNHNLTHVGSQKRT